MTHLGCHAEILREGIDGAAGLMPTSTNLPDVAWTASVDKLRRMAEQFPDGG